MLALNIIEQPNATSDVELLKCFDQFLNKYNKICPHITLATKLGSLVSAVIEFVAEVRPGLDSCPSTDTMPGMLAFPTLEVL